MPCRGPETNHAQNYSDFQDEIDRLTQLLCYACGKLREIEDGTDGQGLTFCDERLVDWAEEHHEQDEFRVRPEMEATCKPDEIPCNLAARFVEAARKVHPVSSWHQKWFSDLAYSVVRKKIKEREERQIAEEYTEAVRNAAIKKLTDEERQLLGV